MCWRLGGGVGWGCSVRCPTSQQQTEGHVCWVLAAETPSAPGGWGDKLKLLPTHPPHPSPNPQPPPSTTRNSTLYFS